MFMYSPQIKERINEKGEKEMLPGAWLKHEVHARV